MKTLNIAYDDFGQILSIVEEGGDLPVTRPGVNVTEIAISGEMEDMELNELARRSHIDVAANRLMDGPIEDPYQKSR
jgi:hypothetical protein